MSGAIASIAFGEEAPLVDGNVIRVFSRIRAIAAHPKHKQALKLIWFVPAAKVNIFSKPATQASTFPPLSSRSLAGELVRGDRPGDLNQALMELGATVCTPKSPSCSTCPVAEHCLARREQANRRRPVYVSDDDGGSDDIMKGASPSSSSAASNSDSAVVVDAASSTKQPLPKGAACKICDDGSFLEEDGVGLSLLF